MKYVWTKRKGKESYLLEKVLDGRYTPIAEAWPFSKQGEEVWYGRLLTVPFGKAWEKQESKKRIKEKLIEEYTERSN